MIDPEPRPQPDAEPLTARSLGLLNVVFGVLLLLGVAYEVGLVLALPAIGRLMDWGQSLQQQEFDERLQADRERFEQQLKEAESDEEREVIEARRAVFEMNPARPPNVMPFSFDFLDSEVIRRGALVKGAVMGVLYALMVASGVGLWKLRGWGRSLSLAVAALMIPAVVVFTIGSVREANVMAERWSDGMVKTLLAREDPEVTPELAEVMEGYEAGMRRLFLTSSATTTALVMLYPIVVLAVALRPGVRAAVSRPLAS